jgi:CDP-glucose 4,6-dehydratase
MEDVAVNSFWARRRVLVTGHTGFKGAWLAFWLRSLGAQVVGVSLPPEHADGAYAGLGPWVDVEEHFIDIRDVDVLAAVVRAARPEVVLHLAAQALVRRAYAQPAVTYATNVTGTANVLVAAEEAGTVEAVLVVTSDKVYQPTDGAPHAETDRLGGLDPYSASKAATELVALAWPPAGPIIATARAGNVIGGGDRGEDRLVPDALAAADAEEPVVLRHPSAVRPWQFVLEPLSGYLAYAERLITDARAVPRSLNFGPPLDQEPVTVEAVVGLLSRQLGDLRWTLDAGPHPHETHALRLDARLAGVALGWRSRSTVEQALRWTVEWHREHRRGGDLRLVAARQIEEFQSL